MVKEELNPKEIMSKDKNKTAGQLMREEFWEKKKQLKASPELLARFGLSKTAGQLLREEFWEKKKKRKFSPEIKEILEKYKEESLKNLRNGADYKD